MVASMGGVRDSGVTILCSGSSACKELTVNLTDFTSFTLFCVGTESCQYIELNLQPSADSIGDGVIHCAEPNACNDILIRTSSVYTELLMYEHSEGVILDNGVGYLSDIENIQCNDDIDFRYDAVWFDEDADSVRHSIIEQYF